MKPEKPASQKPLYETNPELFDGYDGKDRNPEQQKQFDAHVDEILEGAPDWFKQGIADRKQEQEKQALP